MTKEKRIKSVFFTLLVFLVGFTKVSAASYTGFDYTAQLYDNLGPTLSSVTTSGPASGTGQYEGYIAYNANSSGGAWGISSPVTLIANHTYTLTANIPNECGTPILSSYNRIGVGTSLSNAKTSYQNNTNVTEVYSKAIGNNTYLIQYAFTPTTNASFIVFPFATSVTCTSSRTILESVAIEDLGVDAVTQDEINTSLTNQTSEINTSIENSTNIITDALTDVEDSINDTITDNFNDCRNSYNLFDKNTISFSNGYVNTSGELVSHNNWRTSDYISVNPNTTYTFSGFTTSWTIYEYSYDSSQEYLDVVSGTGSRTSFTFTTDSNTYYIRLGIYAGSLDVDTLMLNEGSIAKDYEVYGEEICSNKIDETNDKLDETNQNLNDIEEALTDDSSIDMSSLGDTAGWLPAGPVDSIINIPLTLLNSLNTSLSGSCTPLTMNIPFVNKSFTFPCMSELLMKIDGFSTFWSWLGAIASVIILYKYLMNLYAWVDNILMMRVELDEAMGCDMANWGRL